MALKYIILADRFLSKIIFKNKKENTNWIKSKTLEIVKLSCFCVLKNLGGR